MGAGIDLADMCRVNSHISIPARSGLAALSKIVPYDFVELATPCAQGRCADQAALSP